MLFATPPYTDVMACGLSLSRLLHNAVCLLTLFTPLHICAQIENGAIAGQITLSRGSFPPERIKLTLQTRGIVVSEVWTDTEGKFLFRDLPSNLYHLSIAEDKYESYEADVKVEPRTNPVNILTITLSPKVSNDTKLPVHGTNPYLVDPAEYQRNFPKNAVKEFKRGTESNAKGNYQEAIQHYQTALKLAPNFYPAHNDLGTIYVSRGKFVEAQAEFEAVLKSNQSDTEAYFNLGNVFLLTNRYDDASRMVGEGLKRQPNSGYGQFLIGSIYERQARMTEAERALREAVRLDPNISRVHLELVNVYLRQQRNEDAITELKLFIKNFPSDPLAQHASEVLQKLRPQQRSEQ